ncbi:ATP-binding protein [Streptomyces diacarni]|uniref:ATP-binding protein n=1 Tax=Streptomyces diacarni TaxID=2800381 RepID=UPI0033E6AEB4
MEPEDLQPSVDLLESMRSIGYSLGSAIADLIDNSITAKATQIDVDLDVVDGRYIALLDNGLGMTSSKAREALRLAGSVGDRVADDLGRFGLGLKTASLSQARTLTVVTKQGETITALRWDIDYVKATGRWAILVLSSDELSTLPFHRQLLAQQNGTLVIWQKLDLLLGDTPTPGAHLAEKVVQLHRDLGLIFHRFISDRRKPIRVIINGVATLPIDPFLKNNPKTQRSGIEPMPFGECTVEFEAFTLPHSSDLSRDDRKRHDLGEGMREAQGFYFYRNRRLISYGSWHGLARITELSKQTRVQVDIPSDLDSLWQLDIMKSRAEPPASFKQRLRQLLRPLLEQGHRVHTFRGRRERGRIEHIWSKIRTKDGFRYEINFDSPLVKSALQNISDSDLPKVAGLLRTVANTFPILDAYAELASNNTNQQPVESAEEVRTRLVEIRDSGLLSNDPKIASTQLSHVEPFNNILDLEHIIEDIWEG